MNLIQTWSLVSLYLPLVRLAVGAVSREKKKEKKEEKGEEEDRERSKMVSN